jgi:hypothetical protein
LRIKGATYFFQERLNFGYKLRGFEPHGGKMSLYTVKKVKPLSLIKIFGSIIIIVAVLVTVIYTLMLKNQFKDLAPFTELIGYVGGFIFTWALIAIIVIALVACLYNLLASKIGGIAVELEPKD